jgi:hypothetical protein
MGNQDEPVWSKAQWWSYAVSMVVVLITVLALRIVWNFPQLF